MFYLLLVLWAEPEASRALPLTPTAGVDMKDMRSVISNLQGALNLVIRDLNKVRLRLHKPRPKHTHRHTRCCCCNVHFIVDSRKRSEAS